MFNNSDTGNKSAVPSCSNSVDHIRVYGRHYYGGTWIDYLLDPLPNGWGAYVFASTHVDYHENCSDSATGWEDDARTVVENKVLGAANVNFEQLGWYYINNQANWGHVANSGGSHAECYGTYGNGYWASSGGNPECAEHDGYADWVDMS